MGYSRERKARCCPPNNGSIADLVNEEGISDASLHNWRQQARNEGKLMPVSDNTPEGWVSRDKFAAVLETAAMSEAEIVPDLADRGVYPASESTCYRGIA